MKVDILFKKDEEGESKMVFEIAEMVQEISLDINAKVDINVTNNFRDFSHLATNFPKTPVVVINNHLEFAGMIPDREKIKEKMLGHLGGDGSLLE